MGIAIVAIGVWILQDALASIVFYPKEKWMWNHMARLVRAVMGVALIVMGAYDLLSR